MRPVNPLMLGWLIGASVFAFALFGLDKLWAGRPGQRRVSEFHLVLAGALGGWFGGLLAMLLFRHKTSKLSFQLKYAVGFLVFAGLLYVALRQG